MLAEHNSQEHNLTYALKDGKMVYVGDVPRGLACGCLCPKCKQPLEARQGHIRQQHFAHQGEKAGLVPCHDYYMTAVHMLAEQLIEEKKQVMVPSYKNFLARKLFFKEVEREKRNDRKDLQPDIVGIDGNDERWMIEIRYSHEVDDYKRAKIKELAGNCLEIDVREQTLEGLAEFLFNSKERRTWINAPAMERKIIVMRRKILQRFADYFRRVNQIALPSHDLVCGFQEDFTNIQIIDDYYLIGDGTGGQKYLISIRGKWFEQHYSIPKGFDRSIAVLSIFVDDTQNGIISIEKSLSRVEWMRFPETGIIHDVFIKKRVEGLKRQYKDLKGWEIETCLKCPYRPRDGRCRFILETIVYDSTTYNLCNREHILQEKRNAEKELAKLKDEEYRRRLQERNAKEVYEKPLSEEPHAATSSELIEFAQRLRRNYPFPGHDGSIVIDRRWYKDSSGILILYGSGKHMYHYENYQISHVTMENGTLSIETRDCVYEFQANAEYKNDKS